MNDILSVLPPRTPFGRFFLPGPTEVHPEVLEAMTRPMIGHRGAGMSRLMEAVQPVLAEVFGTARPVFVSSSSATGMMEAAVRNGVSARALTLVNGAFSQRFHDLVEACGREAVPYAVPAGSAHAPDEVLRRLAGGGIDAVTVVHSETATGVLNPLPEIAEAVREAERRTGEPILLLVDGVTSVGGMEVAADAWGVDLLLTGSQKALALPPGLAFACASERLMDRAAGLPGRGQYFDLHEFAAHGTRHQTPNTPALPLFYALAAQAERIRAEGVAERARRHERMARRTLAWVEERGARWGLGPFAPPGRRSPTVTAIATDGARDPARVCAAMADRGWTLGTGYGTLRETTFRIGHMGDHTVDELDELLAVLEEVLG